MSRRRTAALAGLLLALPGCVAYATGELLAAASSPPVRVLERPAAAWTVREGAQERLLVLVSARSVDALGGGGAVERLLVTYDPARGLEADDAQVVALVAARGAPMLPPGARPLPIVSRADWCREAVSSSAARLVVEDDGFFLLRDGQVVPLDCVLSAGPPAMGPLYAPALVLGGLVDLTLLPVYALYLAAGFHPLDGGAGTFHWSELRWEPTPRPAPPPPPWARWVTGGPRVIGPPSGP